MAVGLSVLSIAYPFAPVGPEAVGGAEQILATLDAALVAAGHRSVVLACRGSRVAGELLALAAPPARIDAEHRLRTYAQLRQIVTGVLAGGDFDLVHCHGVDVAAYLPPRGLPVLVTLHLPLDHYPRELLATARPDTHLLPVSRSQARSGAGLALLPPISNGVALPPPHVHARRGFALALGRICPEKGYDRALAAAQAADCALLLAGQVHPYPEHQRCFEQEIRPRLDARRRYIGPVHGARKRRLLAAARCVLIPSRVAETSSLAAMEALASGTPVIAWNCGALPELIEHGRTGLLVDCVAGMAAALRAIGCIDGTACRAAAARRFDAARMAREYLALYAALTRSTRPRGA